MRKFLSKFSPLVVSLVIGAIIAFLSGEVIIAVLMGFFFKNLFWMSVIGYALGFFITLARLVHMHRTTMGTIYNEESNYIQFFSGKAYALRNGVTMIAWVCILYFLGQACMLAAIAGTIITSKVAVFTQPITDKLFITKIFK